jgi:hypothetical protein
MTQMALYEAGAAGREDRAGSAGTGGTASRVGRAGARARAPRRGDAPLCAACQAREARYGFRDDEEDDPAVDRPRTLCFHCFRMELDRRRAIAAQLARGWNATQAALPLSAKPLPGKLDALRRRRGRAQIAARHALELR